MDKVEDSHQGRVLNISCLKEIDFVVSYPDFLLLSGHTHIVKVAVQSLELCLLSLIKKAKD